MAEKMPVGTSPAVAKASHWADIAKTAFDAALAAGHPADVTRAAMRDLADKALANPNDPIMLTPIMPTPIMPTLIIAIGKAGASMTLAARDFIANAPPNSPMANSPMVKNLGHVPSIVVTTDESLASEDGDRLCADMENMQVFASSHPVPDERGLIAGKAVAKAVDALAEDDHLLLLISGGGSALVPAPSKGMTLADKQALHDALLASGLDILEMNAVRRLFSTLKGGRLARLAAPARITQFLLSDVPGDHFEAIASGPAVGDPVLLEDVIKLIKSTGLGELDGAAKILRQIEAGKADLPVRPGDAVLDKVTSHLLASNDLCRNAASHAVAAALLGGDPDSCVELSLPQLTGDAAKLGAVIATRIVEVSTDEQARAKIVWAVTGGETTVRLDQNYKSGKGGRAQEMALAFAATMHAMKNPPDHWMVLVAGTDGRDGPTDAAGAIITSEDIFDSTAAAIALQNHDSYPYLDARDQLLKTSPTGTNLGDIAIFITGKET